MSTAARSKLLKIAFLLVWAALFAFLAFNSSIRNQLQAYCEYHPVLAPFILIFIQLLLSSLLLPCSPITVLAGLLWGFGLGLLYSTFATLMSSLCTFFIARKVLPTRLSALQVFPAWGKIQGLIERHSWRASMLAHMNPVLPGSSLGYLFGGSGISLSSYMAGAVLGTLPLQLINVGLGHSLGVSLGGPSLQIILVMLLVIIALLLYRFLVPGLLDKKQQH